VLDPGFIAVYNLFYTSNPVLALAFFEQDVKPHLAIKVKDEDTQKNVREGVENRLISNKFQTK
jgi:hypothetical protein